ncbi:MAG TPA: DUF6141 family protein [Candidatus Bathyarchaeia archaeon]|nr:DUF6141 family protein [Candidatus Bathyarchaeia archaeon]
MNNSDDTLFHEVQPLRAWWIWLTLLVPIAVSWWLFIMQIVLGVPTGTNPAPDIVVWVIWLAFGVGLPVFAYSTTLTTDVRTDGVSLRFFPLYSRTIPLGDIVTYEALQYHPVLEYGGWGIRFGTHRRRAYTVSGNRGVELELTTGAKLLVGSRRPDELVSAIRAVKAL